MSGVSLQPVDEAMSDLNEKQGEPSLKKAKVVGDSALNVDETLGLAGSSNDGSTIADNAETNASGLNEAMECDSDDNESPEGATSGHVYAHSVSIYPTLPFAWYGAPEFKWRKCYQPEDSQLLILCNILQEDMYLPWVYPVILRAHRVVTDFSQGSDRWNVSEASLCGRIELYFPDDYAIASCVLNHLIHVRTSPHRRIKILIPQSEALLNKADELKKRLGRYREPLISMRRLVLKPVRNEITEEDIRSTVFKGYDIEDVHFDVDPLKLRMATITFSTVESAISAHAQSSYVYFGSETNWARVYYAYVDLKDWGMGRSYEAARLLTHAQLRIYKREKEKAKEDARTKEEGDTVDSVKAQLAEELKRSKRRRGARRPRGARDSTVWRGGHAGAPPFANEEAFFGPARRAIW